MEEKEINEREKKIDEAAEAVLCENMEAFLELAK